MGWDQILCLMITGCCFVGTFGSYIRRASVKCFDAFFRMSMSVELCGSSKFTMNANGVNYMSD
jgi:hypothetical protein